MCAFWPYTVLTDSIHGGGAVTGLAEGPGPSQVLGTHSEYVGETLHQVADLDPQRVDEGAVHSCPVFAVHLLPFNPVAQDWTSIIFGFMPGEVGGARRHLMDSGSVGSIRGT